MSVLTFEFQEAGCYIVNTANEGADNVPLGRIAGSIKADQPDIVAGTLLGKITATGEYVAYDPLDGSDGSEVVAGVSFGHIKNSPDVQHAPIDTGHMAVQGDYLILPKGLGNSEVLTAIEELSLLFTIRNQENIVSLAS